MSTAATVEAFTGTATADLVGITYRMLDYWARTDLIRPSLADARGSGSRRLYAYRDLLELQIVKQLLDAGVHLGTVRDLIAELRALLDEDHTDASLIVHDRRAVLARTSADLVALVRACAGVVLVLSLDQCRSELDERIRSHRHRLAASVPAGGSGDGPGVARDVRADGGPAHVGGLAGAAATTVSSPPTGTPPPSSPAARVTNLSTFCRADAHARCGMPVCGCSCHARGW